MHNGDQERIREIMRIYNERYPTGEDSIALAITSAKREQASLAMDVCL
jgi:hypothetical protein